MPSLLRLSLYPVALLGFSGFSTLSVANANNAENATVINSKTATSHNQYGPISQGESLWSIAAKIYPDQSVSVHQVMQALYQHNPKSFTDSNLNNLIAGRYLKIPTLDFIRSINHSEVTQHLYQNAGASRAQTASAETAKTDNALTAATPQQLPQQTINEDSVLDSNGFTSNNYNTQISVTAALEYRYYWQQQPFAQQHTAYGAAFIEPEIYHSWNDDYDSITFKPFYRWDQHDSERSHFDIRELMWLHVGEDWELRAGIGSVFWGQTESQHLVDIINQTDLVEASDGEDKLGQPMVNLTLIRDWGSLDLFVLPGFRDRTFPGPEGRLRAPLLIHQDDALYQSDRGDNHIDYAARWSHSIDIWDLGIAWFDGTSREPKLVTTVAPDGQVSLTPFYPQMQQLGIDALAAVDDWLYKFEGIYRKHDDIGNNKGDSFTAITAGFEYTSVGIFESVVDLGWLMEYQYDDRGDDATGPGQNDLMLGTRFALNDVNGTEILVAYVQDLDDFNTYLAFVEASSRITDNWKWRLDARLFSTDNRLDQLYWLRADDHIQFSLEYYY